MSRVSWLWIALALVGFGTLALRKPILRLPSPDATGEVSSASPVANAAADVTNVVASAAPAATSPAAAVPASTPDETQMMAQLRAMLRERQPQGILDLARAIDQSYPDGSGAEERSLYIIDSLIALDRIVDMRDAARRHLARWPNGATASRVIARTGVHPDPRPLE